MYLQILHELGELINLATIKITEKNSMNTIKNHHNITHYRTLNKKAI